MHTISSKLAPLRKSEGAKYRQITAHLRQLIRKGEFKPGARLPTAREMAKVWGTNAFTIHRALTPLVTEGLIERLRRSGTFVRDYAQQIGTVAIYFGGNLWSPENTFYLRLLQYLDEIYTERNGRCLVFIDKRIGRDKETPLPALQRAVDQGEVQGVIATMLQDQEGWLQSLRLPLAMFSAGGIQPSRVEFFETVAAHFATKKCRTVGMLCPRFRQEWFLAFKTIANRHGLKVNSDWSMAVPPAADPSLEFAGYRLFKEYWSNRSHPDGIFVYPDVVCRGVIIAALELGLRIPRDVQLIFHRNTSLEYVCPWKLPFLVLDVKEVALRLVDYADAQHRHEKVPLPIITSHLIDS